MEQDIPHEGGWRSVGAGRMILRVGAALTLRIAAERLEDWPVLVGKSLWIGESLLRVCVPRVLPLRPATRLRCERVYVPGGSAVASIEKELGQMGVSRDQITSIQPRPDPPGSGTRLLGRLRDTWRVRLDGVSE